MLYAMTKCLSIICRFRFMLSSFLSSFSSYLFLFFSLSVFLFFFGSLSWCPFFIYTRVPPGSPSSGGYVAVYVFNINQPSLPTPFYSVLLSVSVFMAISTVFHSINSPDNSPLSHSGLPVLFLPHWSFQLHTSL